MWLSRLACSFLCSTQSNLFRPNSAESASFRQIPTHSGELKSILANSSECAQFSRIQPNPIYFGRIPLHFADWNPIQINFSEHGRINPIQLKVSPNLPNTGEGPEVWRCRSTLACVRGCFLPKVPHTSEPRAPPNSAMTFFGRLRTLVRTLLRRCARFFARFWGRTHAFFSISPSSAEFRRIPPNSIWCSPISRNSAESGWVDPIQPNSAEFGRIRPSQFNSAQFRRIQPNSAESGQFDPIQPNSAEFGRIRPIQANSSQFRRIPPNPVEFGRIRPIRPKWTQFSQTPPNRAESGNFGPIQPNSSVGSLWHPSFTATNLFFIRVLSLKLPPPPCAVLLVTLIFLTIVAEPKLCAVKGRQSVPITARQKTRKVLTARFQGLILQKDDFAHIFASNRAHSRNLTHPPPQWLQKVVACIFASIAVSVYPKVKSLPSLLSQPVSNMILIFLIFLLLLMIITIWW